MSYFELGGTFQSPLLTNLLREAVKNQDDSKFTFTPRPSRPLSRPLTAPNNFPEYVLPDVKEELRASGVYFDKDKNKWIAPGGREFSSGVDAASIPRLLEKEKEIDKPVALEEDLYAPEQISGPYEKVGEVSPGSRVEYTEGVVVTPENQAALMEELGKTADQLPIGFTIQDDIGEYISGEPFYSYSPTKELFGQTAQMGIVDEEGNIVPRTERYEAQNLSGDYPWYYFPPEGTGGFEDLGEEFYEDEGYGKVIGQSPLGTVLSQGIYLEGAPENVPVQLTGDPVKDREIAENLKWATQEEFDKTRQFIPWGGLQAYLASEEGKERYGDIDYATDLLAPSGIKYGGTAGGKLTTPELVDLEDIVQLGEFTPSSLLDESLIKKGYAGQDYYRQLQKLGYK